MIAEQTNGACYDIFTPFDEILGWISSQVANTYLITYKSSNPAFDGIERHVVVTVTYQGDQAMCDGTYTPGSAPRIRRTQDTLALHDQSWAAGTTFAIKAEITDDVTPYVQSAKLYYRTTGDATYVSTPMTHSSDIWTGTILGGAVKTPGLDYYISATDGESTATSPPVDPRTRPHQLAILPNVAPQITHTPVTTAMANTPVTITAEVVDNTNVLDSIELWYRKVGQLIFKTNGQMTNIGGDTYQDTIPSSYVTEAGVEYCILAYDDLGIGNWHGSFFDPHVITVSSNQPPNTEIETAEIDPAKGTAKFTWSGSDDTTPAKDLLYCYRLRKDSSYSGWSTWSASTTKTYTNLSTGNYRFQVRAKDGEGAIDPSPASDEFAIAEAPLNCVVHLRPRGVEASIGVIGDFETFDIYVGESTGDIWQVRFSSDESLDGVASGEWTEWYDWNSNALFSPWDATAKTMAWAFTTGGSKEVWAEVSDATGGPTARDCAPIKVEVPEWRKLAMLGDVLYDPTFLGERAGHVGIYVGDGKAIEALKAGVQETSIVTWDEQEEAMLLQVSASLHAKEEAVDFAHGQLGKPYDYKWVQKSSRYDAPSWYCSELVWAAYFNQGVNLEYTPDPWVVTPSVTFLLMRG